MADTNPFLDHPSKSHVDGPFHREEVALANRNSGLLLEALRHDVTPAGLHYLLNHFDVPFVPDVSQWSVAVSGDVDRPFAISLDEIKALPQRTLRVTLECAGNGRANLTPRWPSMPWTEGATGTAEWTGTPLNAVLARAGVKPSAIDIVFYGADRGFDHVEHNYGRALSPAKAMSDDVLLVTAMNGQPLLPQHGFPLRLVVPGWYGMASVKWLDRIEVWSKKFDGPQQVATYIYKKDRLDPGIPVTAMRVKSLMVPPGLPDWYTRRRLVERGAVTVHGRAWSGDGVPITQVEFSDGGAWQMAELSPPAASKYAWRGWSATWQAAPSSEPSSEPSSDKGGERVLMCRATDANGDVQPLEPRYDNGGFGNNAVHRVHVTVR
jgi:DMSO/TMAO reductase YedYZ molybdopterin-dependent catalytic subunit